MGLRACMRRAASETRPVLVLERLEELHVPVHPPPLHPRVPRLQLLDLRAQLLDLLLPCALLFNPIVVSCGSLSSFFYLVSRFVPLFSSTQLLGGGTPSEASSLIHTEGGVWAPSVCRDPSTLLLFATLQAISRARHPKSLGPAEGICIRRTLGFWEGSREHRQGRGI